MFYIVAENYYQARELARTIGLTDHQWDYLVHVHQLMGLREPTLILWGNYQNRHDWTQIEEQIQVRGAVVLDLAAIELGSRQVIASLRKQIDINKFIARFTGLPWHSSQAGMDDRGIYGTVQMVGEGIN